MLRKNTIIMIILAVAQNSFLQADLNSGLIGHWNFDTGAGDIAYDSSPQNYHGNIIGGPEWVNGISGKALKFDGVDDYVDIPNTSDLDLIGGYTLSAWAKFSEDNIDQVIVGKHISGKSGGFTLESYENRLTYFFFGWRIRSNEENNDNNWHHIVGLYSSGINSLYIDGNYVWEMPNDYQPTTANIRIGGIFAGDLSGAFNGIIDEVSIYNRPLSAGEVQDIYNIPEPCTLYLLAVGGLAILRKQR